MMKTTKLFAGLAIVAGIALAGCNTPQVQFETINVEALKERVTITRCRRADWHAEQHLALQR